MFRNEKTGASINTLESVTHMMVTQLALALANMKESPEMIVVDEGRVAAMFKSFIPSARVWKEMSALSEGAPVEFEMMSRRRNGKEHNQGWLSVECFPTGLRETHVYVQRSG